jgi:hypothetical protein
MLCLECGEEMRLVQVTKDTTMPVSGYEHHTWECSACSAVEQRMAFARDTTPTQTAPVEQTQSVSAEPTQGVPAERNAAMPVEPTEAIPVELTEPVPIALTQTKPVEPIQALPINKTVAVEPPQAKQTHQALPPAMIKTNAWAKALGEKLRNLKERATAAKEVAGKTARPTQFNRNWDNKSRPVPASPASSTASSHVKSEEPIPPTEPPIACPAPTSRDDRVAPGSNAPAARKLRDRLGELVRNMRRRTVLKGSLVSRNPSGPHGIIATAPRQQVS